MEPLNPPEIPNGAIRYSRNFEKALLGVSSKAETMKIINVLSIIAILPEIGGYYNPIYPAAKPPFPVRRVLAGNYVIFYGHNEEEGIVEVYYLRHQRQNPTASFEKLSF